MPADDSQTFECTICEQKHKVVPDTHLPGHSGHKLHCLFCLLHTLYRSTIPAAPSTRLTGEQVEKKNIIRTRKIVLGTITPVLVLAYFTFRWQMHFWNFIGEGLGDGKMRLEDRLLLIMICILGIAPSGFILGFLVSVLYYVFWFFRKKQAKKRKASQEPSTATPDTSDTVPLEEKPLAELRFKDLREANEPIQIVITPPNEPEQPPPVVENRMSKLLGVVTDKFRTGYDGRAARRESWAALEEIHELLPQGKFNSGGKNSVRPTTEWPEI